MDKEEEEGTSAWSTQAISFTLRSLISPTMIPWLPREPSTGQGLWNADEV